MSDFLRYGANAYGLILPKHTPSPDARWNITTPVMEISTGKKLFSYRFEKKILPAAPVPLRVLLVFHGYGEHGGRYFGFPEYLYDSVDVVHVSDLRGHGRSDGRRGHIEHFGEFTDDAVELFNRVETAATRNGVRPEMHILGHSLGGLIALRFAKLHSYLPIQSMTVSAPFLGLFKKLNPWLQKSVGILSRVWGTLALRGAFDPHVLSQDPEVLRVFHLDRLNHQKMTPQFFKELAQAQFETLQFTTGIRTPVLFLVPENDQLVDGVLTQKLFTQLVNAKKSWIALPDTRHEPMNDIHREEFFKNLGSWIHGHAS